METKGFSGLKEKRAEMQSCRAGRGLPLRAQKAIDARRREKNREVERHLEQAAVLESKAQQNFPASHSHHPLVTTGLSQRNPMSWQPWPLLGGH